MRLSEPAVNYSIIIPHYNIPDLLIRCLRSIPVREDVQVIVVDDCSPGADRYKELYPELSRPYLELYSTPKGGSAGRARNIGLEHAKGEWVIFADADDYWHTENLIELFDLSIPPDCKMVAWGIEFLFNDGNKEEYFVDSDFSLRQIGDKKRLLNSFAPWRKMVRRQLIDEHHLRFEEIAASNDVMFHIHLMGSVNSEEIMWFPKLTYIWQQRKGSITQTPDVSTIWCKYKASLRCNEYALSKGWGKVDVTRMYLTKLRTLSFIMFYIAFFWDWYYLGFQQACYDYRSVCDTNRDKYLRYANPFVLMQAAYHRVRKKDYVIMLLLCFVMWLNLYYMHHTVFLSNYKMNGGIAYPFLSWWFDVIVSWSFFMLCTIGRRKLSLVLTYLFLSVFIVGNIVYSRFFAQYATLGVLSEISNLRGTWWLEYLPQALRWTDLILLFTTGLFVVCLRTLTDSRTYKDAIFIASVMFASTCLFAYKCNDKLETLFDFGWKHQINFIHNQEQTIFLNGILKTQVYCNIIRHTTHQKLTADDKNTITTYLRQRNNSEMPLPDSCTVKGSPNIVFIIVESYMSVASQTSINGKEITPNLNTLIKQSGSYYNFQVSSNKGRGESSDAQVAYFTGLLPLKSEVSVLYVIQNDLVAIPKLLHEQKGYNTYMTLPTGRYFWHQSEANLKYGIDQILQAGNDDNHYWCQDEELFEYVTKQTPRLKQPYMHVILTLSMHGKYDKDFLSKTQYKSPFNFPPSYSVELCNYLKKCYYTDIQIGKYIQYLKDIRQYDNTLIVICSDHETDSWTLSDKNLSKDLPFILVNSRIPTERFYDGRINQIDMYPTLLDLFGLDTEWRGIGHSLLRGNYTDSISDEDRRISDMIMMGNYFAN